MCGRNADGRCGDGTQEDIFSLALLMTDDSIVKIRCGGWHSMIYKSNGELWVFGENSGGQVCQNFKFFWAYKVDSSLMKSWGLGTMITDSPQFL